MNWDAIGAVGEIVGALVVVITVLYLAQQVRISNRTQRVQAFERIIGMIVEGRRDVTNNPQLANVIAKAMSNEHLDNAEMLQLKTHISKWPEYLHVGFQHWKAGSLEEYEWESLCEGAKTNIRKHKSGQGNVQDQVIYEAMQNMPEDMRDYFGVDSRDGAGGT